MRPLDGKVAIVTGATKSKGLGKAIAVKRATEKGDLEHAKKDQRMLDRFCNK